MSVKTPDSAFAKIPEFSTEDCQTENLDSGFDTHENSKLREDIKKLKSNKKKLKNKIEDLIEQNNEEISKRLQNEKKSHEFYENYCKLAFTVNESANKHEYLMDENKSLYREISLLKNHILVLNQKFSSLLNKMKNGEKLNE